MRGPPVIVQPLSVIPRVRRRRHPERGAAAVEMALVLPVLLFLLMGMIDFGRAYSTQIQLSAAAREGVRLASLNTGNPTDPNNPTGNTAIAQRVTSAAGGLPTFAVSCSLGPTNAQSYACITYCPNTATNEATVVVKSYFTWITGISGISSFIMGGAGGGFPPGTIQAKGVMRCAG